MSQFTTPILIPSGGPAQPLERVAFGDTPGKGGYDEAWLQKLLFEYPDALPCEEIDPAYSDLVPICREMGTDAGPIDLVYVTPQGRLVLVETKLWRNPQARREAVVQILDYAKHLSTWEYEDLLREVLRSVSGKGNILYDKVKGFEGALEEKAFVDQVSRNLRTGQFLLLIVGDGIREGVRALAEFLEQFGSLEFTFGLVEVGVFDVDGIGRLVQPRILAKTLVVKRTVVVADKGVTVREEETRESEGGEPVDPAALAQRRELEAFYLKFWTDFIGKLHLDDSSQPFAKPNTGTNIYFSMPPSGGTAWVSAYFAQSKSRVGVYLTFTRNTQFAPVAWKALKAEAKQIEEELGVPVDWLTDEDGKFMVACRMSYEKLDGRGLDEIRKFFADRINRFVNVFRPRLERLVEKL